jgi:uroporphyrinogen-III synthase
MLRAAGFRVERRIAYRAMPAPTLAEPARQALQEGRLRAALFFSPRSAACSMALLRGAALDSPLDSAVREVEAVAISPRVATVLSGLPWRSIRAAPRPDQDSLLEMLGTP